MKETIVLGNFKLMIPKIISWHKRFEGKRGGVLAVAVTKTVLMEMNLKKEGPCSMDPLIIKSDLVGMVDRNQGINRTV